MHPSAAYPDLPCDGLQRHRPLKIWQSDAVSDAASSLVHELATLKKIADRSVRQRRGQDYQGDRGSSAHLWD